METVIENIIKPDEKNLGDGFKVRRALPSINQRAVGPFIFWDHLGPVRLNSSNNMKVRAHPHIGLATITYLFSGEIMHRDNLGNEQLIRPGEVNWMTAGRSIVHSERTQLTGAEQMNLEAIQLWLALPTQYEEVKPSFFHTKEENLPIINHGSAKLRLIAGEALGQKSPVPIYSDLFYLSGSTTGDHKNFEFDLKENCQGAVYIIDGQVEVEGQAFRRFDLITYKSGTKVVFQSKGDVSFMLFGGKEFPEKRSIWWNFVSSDLEKIEKAKRAWRNKSYKPVINETEYIPLPEN